MELFVRLATPSQGLNFRGKDVHGKPFQFSDLRGKRVMLCFFRDAACPFCHFRVYELTQNYSYWQAQNLEVIAVFSDTAEQVRRFVAKHPRPFTMIADPNLTLYNRFGVEHSGMALLKALCMKMPRILKGFFLGAKPSNNPHVKLVPADFLFAEDGSLQRTWYGRNTSDHIPLPQVQAFIDAQRAAKPSAP
jgi:thioredoxin-dependent peroxiredoxin